MEKDCRNCKHDGNQMFFGTACTGCSADDILHQHWEEKLSPKPDERSEEQIHAVVRCGAIRIKITEDSDRYYIDLRGIGYNRISCNRKHPRTALDYPLTKSEALINILCQELINIKPEG